MLGSRSLSAARLRDTRVRWPELAAALLVSIFAAYVLSASGGWKAGVAAAAIAVFLVLGLVAPAGFVVAFILIRPLTDWLSEKNVVSGVNASGCLALLVIG